MVLVAVGLIGFLVLAWLVRRSRFMTRTKQTNEALSYMVAARPADAPRFPRYPRGRKFRRR